MCCLFKRVLAASLAASLLIGLVACGKKDKGRDGTSTDSADVHLSSEEASLSADTSYDSEYSDSFDETEEESLSTPTSDDDNNSAPVEDDSSAPVEDDSSAPVEDDSSAPVEDDSSAPVEDDSSAPVEDDSSAPVEDDSSAPVEDDSSAPVEDDSSAPVEDDSSAPVEDDSSAPVEDDSSAPVEDDSSAPVEDDSSAPVEDDSSAPVEDDSSAPVEDDSSAPVEDDSSAPVEDDSSAPVEDDSSAPVEDDSSAPVEDDSSAPVEDDSSEPVEVDPYAPINPLPDVLLADPVDSFFDNSVFIGYSIMMHFGRYVSEWRQQIDSSILGGAIFCAAVGISFYADRTQNPNYSGTSLPTFRGKAYNFKDLPAATGSDTMYIGLTGYSDLKRSNSSSNCVQYAVNEAIEGLKRIRAANPDLNIVVLSCTYNTGIFSGLTYSRQNNAKVMEYNNLVLDYCNANGIDFIDVATPLTDHRGYFVEAYSTDGEYHIVKEAYYLWMAALRDYATRKQNGTWQNITEMPMLPYLAG